VRARLPTSRPEDRRRAPSSPEASREEALRRDAGAPLRPRATPAARRAKKLGDVHVEGAGEIDQEVFDQLIAEGKSERIARAKAKAAWVKKRKQQLLDEEGGA
jgi:hypothetical protein